MAEKRKRWVRVTLAVVDVPETKMPSGSYDETKLAEQTFSVPVDSELELIVSSDEVSSSVRAIVERVNKHTPKPEPVAEPIGSMPVAPITPAPSRPLERGQTFSTGPAVAADDEPPF